ncbi:MAG TPA: pirin family protein [Terriglobia bacterium]|nr:pirin family protein [Terriglobia bacterium]
MNDPVSDIQSIPVRPTDLGGLRIMRALPRRQRRAVGPWCFFDRFGPLRFSSGTPIDVAPHPHIGLQTVSWLLDGEVIHHDSLGCEALMRAGQLNLMTAGRGIAHSEQTPSIHSGKLDGVQLWVALPVERRAMAPLFDHHAVLPARDFAAGTVTVITGELMGETSPARIFSALVGAEIAFHTRGQLTLPVSREFEHALYVLRGDMQLANRPLDSASLHYLGAGRDELDLSGAAGSRALLLGGVPLPGPLLMWWNFVGSSPEEIAAAREDWIAYRRFGEVKAYRGLRLEAPELASLVSAQRPE